MSQPLFLDTIVSAPTGYLGAIGLPVVLGLVAVYLLLPRPRGYPPWLGAMAAGLALLAAGLLLIRVGGAAVETVLFYCFSAVAVVAGGLLVTQRNPVRAALSFALVVLSSCGLFLLQAAPFLMAATIIIYAGAIIVTFIFVIMLAQQAGLSDADARSREPLLSCIAGFVLLGAILFVLRTTYTTRDLDGLLERTERALQQESAAGMREALGDKRDFLEAFHREAERQPASSETSQRLRDALNGVETAWNEQGLEVHKMWRTLAALYDLGVQVRNRQGSLQPPAQLPLSTYSRQTSGQARAGPDQDRQRADALPRENVAYLGRTLFTDYLLAVELGGTLLLVATIGAIAITARRAEGLR